MEHNLLTSLRKYRPRDGHDPRENFITEAFAWILKSYPDFSSCFVSYILEKIPNATKNVEQLSWSTQVYSNSFYLDMLCEMGNGSALVFENKAWAKLHNNQLGNYRQYAENNYTESYIVLITATSSQHDQNPDLALCWSDIYRLITEWQTQENNETHFIFKNFLELLKYEGMAPVAPISHESIQSYYAGIKSTPPVNSLFNTVYSLLNGVKGHDYWTKIIPTPDLSIRNRWGRIGFDLFDETWTPNVFVGFMMDGKDHFVETVLGEKSPDFSIIIDFDSNCIDLQSNIYKKFVKKISQEIEKLHTDWNFLNHLEDKSAKKINKWHPIHIRKPMLELFEDTQAAEEQAERFMENVKQILDIIFNSAEFATFKKMFV